MTTLITRSKFSFSPTLSIFNFQLTCKRYTSLYISCALCLFYYLPMAYGHDDSIYKESYVALIYLVGDHELCIYN